MNRGTLNFAASSKRGVPAADLVANPYAKKRAPATYPPKSGLTAIGYQPTAFYHAPAAVATPRGPPLGHQDVSSGVPSGRFNVSLRDVTNILPRYQFGAQNPYPSEYDDPDLDVEMMYASIASAGEGKSRMASKAPVPPPSPAVQSPSHQHRSCPAWELFTHYYEPPPCWWNMCSFY